jgi:hypothetical protein
MNYALDHLMLAEDPLLFNLVYIHKYFHICIYFISQDMRKISSAYSDDTKLAWEAQATPGRPFLPKNFKSFFFTHACHATSTSHART